MKTYIEESGRTVSDQFHLNLIGTNTLVTALKAAKNIGDRVDVVKKSIFYGKKVPKDFALSDMRGGPSIKHIDVDVIHSILGSITEAAELAELLLTSIETGEPLDELDICDETGDCMWYMALMLRTLGVSFEDVADSNIRKLRARFPDKFDAEQAKERDLEAEKTALVGE